VQKSAELDLQAMSMDERERIKALLQLARDKTEQGRQILTENISDLFISEEGRLSDHERALMGDILIKLVSAVESVVRAELADGVARMENAPPELISLLANDEIAVARPILEHSPVLRTPELIEIVKQRSQEHRLAIAIRDYVSQDVSDSLVAFGEHDVLEALLKNPDAEISRRSMEYLVAESRRIDQFREPLLNREDLPPALAHRMFWWVSAALRRKILEDFSLDEHELDGALEDATKRALYDQSQTEGTMVRAQRLVHRLWESGDLSFEFLIQALRQQRIQVFVAGLAELANIDIGTAARIFADEGGESMAVVARAIGMNRSEFTSVYLLLAQSRSGGKPYDVKVLKKILELYDSVKKDHALTALRYWRRDPDYQAALSELDAG
jgi:uncharacterized protein (DUF2336 family)